MRLAAREPVLDIADLSVTLRTESRDVTLLDRVSLSLAPGEALGIVGESGSGKSMTALAILGLLPHAARVSSGSIRLRGQDLVGLGERRMQTLRGGTVAIIFQEPAASLNPLMTIARQIGEALRLHRGFSGPAIEHEVTSLLEAVRLPEPGRVARALPHELSGGMLQRCMIAMALAGEPSLLIADEPTTALDASVARGILDLIDELRRARGMALLLISHDLAAIAGRADRVAVMYAGRIVETASGTQLFARPAHPYTRGLIAASPALSRRARKSALGDLPGHPPQPGPPRPLCGFLPRCPERLATCFSRMPPWVTVAPGQDALCIARETGP